MFEELFRNKKVNMEKLIAYGFREKQDGYYYGKNIFDGQFDMEIRIDKTGRADTKMVEKDSGEEYILYKTNASGAFVGEVRGLFEETIKEIVSKCYEDAVFKQPQTLRVIDFIQKRYGDEAEYLWKKFPDNAIWRRKDNAKWYGLVLTVPKSKLGFQETEPIEIMDLRLPPEEMEETLKKEQYYPGWHMNKKHWYTMILDDSVADEELFRRICVSYELAKGTKKK